MFSKTLDISLHSVKKKILVSFDIFDESFRKSRLEFLLSNQIIHKIEDNVILN